MKALLSLILSLLFLSCAHIKDNSKKDGNEVFVKEKYISSKMIVTHIYPCEDNRQIVHIFEYNNKEQLIWNQHRYVPCNTFKLGQEVILIPVSK